LRFPEVSTKVPIFEENKENLGYQDLDIEVDGWSITIEQRVESEKITFSGDG
jgi:hypothetical protein